MTIINYPNLKHSFEKFSIEWIKNEYKLLKKKKNFSENDEKEDTISYVQKYIYNQLGTLIKDDNKTEFTDYFPELFHIFIDLVFRHKPNKMHPLYQFGTFYRAFHNILDFVIEKKTIEFIKEKLLYGECNSYWVDPATLKDIYNSLEIPRENELRFYVRSLILLAKRDLRKRFNEDIKIEL